MNRTAISKGISWVNVIALLAACQSFAQTKSGLGQRLASIRSTVIINTNQPPPIPVTNITLAFDWDASKSSAVYFEWWRSTNLPVYWPLTNTIGPRVTVRADGQRGFFIVRAVNPNNGKVSGWAVK